MDEKTLKSFCSQDAFRESLTQPYNLDEFTIASNGHVLVRVAKIDSYDENSALLSARFISQNRKLFANVDLTNTEFASLPAFEVAPHTCACGNEHTRKVWQDGQVGARRFKAKIFQTISVLPNVQITIPGGEFTAAYIKFDGGDGLIMPYRP